jgi:hypothetical protein
VHVGDRVTIQPGGPLPVAAIYTDLRDRPGDPFWCSLQPQIKGPPGVEFTNAVVRW